MEKAQTKTGSSGIGETYHESTRIIKLGFNYSNGEISIDSCPFLRETNWHGLEDVSDYECEHPDMNGQDCPRDGVTFEGCPLKDTTVLIRCFPQTDEAVKK